MTNNREHLPKYKKKNEIIIIKIENILRQATDSKVINELICKSSIRVVSYFVTWGIALVIGYLAHKKNSGLYPVRGWIERGQVEGKTTEEEIRIIEK